MILALAALIVLSRLSSLRHLWKLAHRQGPGWLFSTEVTPDFANGAGRAMVARYRRWLLAPWLADLMLVPLLWNTDWLLLEQFLMLIASAFFMHLLTMHYAIQARALAGPPRTPRPTSANLLLEPRRLRDHMSPPLEGVILLLTAASFIFANGHWAGFLWLVYLQLGLLLAKAIFVHWRMKLPLNRADDFKRRRKAWLLYHVRIFDAARLLIAACMLVRVALPEVSLWLIAAAVLAYVFYSSAEHRKLKAVAQEVQPMTLAKEFPETPVYDGRRWAGDLLAFDSGSPLVLLRGPQGLIVNLAHRNILWTALYVSGSFLLFWMTRAM